MGKYRDFDPLDPLPADWTDAWQEFWSTLSANFNLRIKPTDQTVLQVVAGAGNDQVGITIEASPRFIAATIERASPGGGVARELDVWVTTTANIFTPGSPGEVDTTNYAFALAITETGVPPGGVAMKRKVATAHWDGAKFTFITPLWLFAAPIGAAGGALSGSYPDPGLADGAVTKVKLAADALNAFLKLAGVADRKVAWGSYDDGASWGISPDRDLNIPHGQGVAPQWFTAWANQAVSQASSQDPVLVSRKGATAANLQVKLSTLLRGNCNFPGVTTYWLGIF